jgi:flagellum-specific ATP synthase
LTTELINLDNWINKVKQMRLIYPEGQVTRVIGLTVEVKGIFPSIGEVCDIWVHGEPVPVKSEVVGFHEQSTLLMPLGELKGISPGCTVIPKGKSLTIKVGSHLLGKIIDGVGTPLDLDDTQLDLGVEMSVDNAPPNPLTRKMIKDVLPTGVRAIDGILTCGKGQRIGIFAGSGVGKSTLLGMIACISIVFLLSPLQSYNDPLLLCQALTCLHFP